MACTTEGEEASGMVRSRLGGFSAFFCVPFPCRLPSLMAVKWPQVGAWAVCFLVLIEQEEKLRKVLELSPSQK